MSGRLLHHPWKMSPVNTWPWRGWQVCGGNRGRREG